MGILKEEYVQIADALLTSLARDLAIFEAENHLFNASYLSAMQSKTDEVRAKEKPCGVLSVLKSYLEEALRSVGMLSLEHLPDVGLLMTILWIYSFC